MRGLSLVVASGGHSSSRCAGLSLSQPLLLRSTGSRHAGSVVVAHGPSCSAACGIFPDKGSNPCPLHWQADSQPLRHQGSPSEHFDSLCCLLPSFLQIDLQTLLLGGLKQPLGLWRILPEKTLCRPSRGCSPDPLAGLTIHGAVRAGQGFTSPAPSKSALLMTVATYGYLNEPEQNKIERAVPSW